MPRDLNEPPPLNAEITAGPNVEHIDNTNLNNKDNPKGFTDIAQAAGQKTGADDSNSSGSNSSGPTVTVTGDLTGSTQVTAGTELMDALHNVSPDFSDYEFTRVDGSPVSGDFEVKGDLTVKAKKKGDDKAKDSGAQDSGSQSSSSAQSFGSNP